MADVGTGVGRLLVEAEAGDLAVDRGPEADAEASTGSGSAWNAADGAVLLQMVYGPAARSRTSNTLLVPVIRPSNAVSVTPVPVPAIVTGPVETPLTNDTEVGVTLPVVTLRAAEPLYVMTLFPAASCAVIVTVNCDPVYFGLWIGENVKRSRMGSVTVTDALPCTPSTLATTASG